MNLNFCQLQIRLKLNVTLFKQNLIIVSLTLVRMDSFSSYLKGIDIEIKFSIKMVKSI